MQQATCKTLRINAYCSAAAINNSQHIGPYDSTRTVRVRARTLRILILVEDAA